MPLLQRRGAHITAHLSMHRTSNGTNPSGHMASSEENSGASVDLAVLYCKAPIGEATSGASPIQLDEKRGHDEGSVSILPPSLVMKGPAFTKTTPAAWRLCSPETA